MATVAQQISRITSRFKKDPNNEVVSTTSILAFLNEAQDMIEAQVVLPAMQSSSTITLVAGTQEYSLASNVFKLVLARYQTNDWILKERNMHQIQARFDNSTGSPQEFYIWGGTIGLYPTPSANEAAGVKYWYIKTLSELVESGAGAGQVTTSELPENFHWVLERGAEMLMAQSLQDERAELFEGKFMQGIQLMKQRYATMTDNLDTELIADDELDNKSTWNFNPYQ